MIRIMDPQTTMKKGPIEGQWEMVRQYMTQPIVDRCQLIVKAKTRAIRRWSPPLQGGRKK